MKNKREFNKGGKIGFDGLAKKVAKRYEGKPVKSEFQDEYGKTYSKAEAMEVGRKVAGKVYRQQQAMEKGGEIDGRYVVSVVDSFGDERATLFRSNNKEEAISKYYELREPFFYKRDVNLVDTKNGEQIEYYDSEMDREERGFAKGGKTKRSKHSLMQDRRRVSKEPWEVAYQKRKSKMEAGGTLPTPFGQAGLVGETGAMNEMDMFAMGGGLPQGVHQYYANTYNPAYSTPHGYAKGGEIDENKAHYSINQDYQIYVDSNFINMSQNALPNSKLKHYGFGEFYLETPNGNIEFIRTDFKIKGFVGRTHRLGGNPNVGLDLLDAMKSKSQQVSGERFAKGGEITVEIVDNFDEQVGYIKGTPLNVVEVDEDDYMITSDGRFLSVGEVEFADQKSEENYYKIINSRLAKGGKVGRYTRDDLPNFLDKIFNKDFIENVSIQKDQMDINFKDDGFIVGEKDIKAVEKKGWTFDSLSTYGTSGISLLFTRKSFAKGGKTQGYNDKLDESLGNRDGVEPMMMQSYKDRRDESKGMEKAMGRRAYQSVGTMDNMAKGGYVYRESDDEDATEFLNKKEVMELIEEHNKSFDTNYKTIESFNKGEQKANGIRSIEKMAKGGKTQGYNDKLDESLGNRNSVEPLIMQSYKDRRDESKAMEKAMGRRAYQSVGTMDKMGKGGIYTVYKDKGYVVVDIHKKDGDYVFLSYPRTKRMANFISKRLKRKKGANQFERKIISFKEAKAQGYGDKLDESLGYRKGKASTKKQNYKDRRNESEAMEKKGGKRKYASVKTMDKGNRRKRKTPMSLAKEIRKEGEKWQDAVKRASAMLKKK